MRFERGSMGIEVEDDRRCRSRASLVLCTVLAVLIGAFTVAPGATAGGSDLPPNVRRELDAQILWADDAHTSAVFIPQQVLQRTPVAELPLDQAARIGLELEIANFKGRGYTCNGGEFGPSEQGSADVTYSFEETLQQYPLAVVGEVVHVVSGWAVASSEAAEAAYVRVDEVLFEEEVGAAPAVGTVVGIFRRGGQVVIGDTTLCRDWPQGFYRPFVGDRIALTGYYRTEDPPFFIVAFRFPVVDDQLLAQPYGGLQKEETVRSLGDLRSRLRRSREGEGRRP